MEGNPQTQKPEDLVIPGIDRWVFNRSTTSVETLLRSLVSALSPQVLISNGGCLFKASLHGPVFHLGLIPTLREGERGYHHDIRLKREDVFTLIGNITTSRELTILFNNPAISESDKSLYRRVYQKLAQLLVYISSDQPLTLDWITTHLLEQKQIFTTPPRTLSELAWCQAPNDYHIFH